ncbi:AAA family ATPase [Streptomyces sp. NPDC091215]|uniref:ATP-dependent nuclease n=1 Tax=Streptomyces sp. NPDC091215 TaxID=3155192 RepID=UPI003440DB0E
MGTGDARRLLQVTDGRQQSGECQEGERALHLSSFSVSGFRSLTDVHDIPVRKPTILAGHNDGGKSAVLDALHFLTGSQKIKEDDRTFVGQPTSADPETVSVPLRCEETVVVGTFELDEWEQAELELPSEIRVRRRAGEDSIDQLEYWGSFPDDTRLRDLSSVLVAELRSLAVEFGLQPASTKKPDLLSAVRAYAREHSSEEAWLPAPPLLGKRMPRLLPFDGKTAQPDAEIKSALSGRFRQHMDDPDLRGKLNDLENDVKDRLRIDAKSLCDHIRLRCPDLAEVFVEPDVSFEHGFRGAPLRVSRAAGEPVGLERSGLGRNRRVALAVWEWTSELLAQEEEDQSPALAAGEETAEPPAVQTIVIYDEPDTHLDYNHQRRVMQLIRDQSNLPHVSVIVATHSMNLIDGVDISDVVHLKLENHRTVIERMGGGMVSEEIDRHLGKIAAGLGLRNSVLLHERCFLAVEGDTEQRAFPLLFQLCEGMSLQAAGVALWACFNNEGALHLARYLAKHERNFMLVVDADSRNLPKSIFKPAKLTQFFGPRAADYVKFVGEPDLAHPLGEKFNELEEAFDDEVWARVANKIWPKDDGGSWAPEDFTQLRGTGKFSEEVKELLRAKCESGPGGKPDMMYRLAMALEDPHDVPEQLRLIFTQVRKLAA